MNQSERAEKCYPPVWLILILYIPSNNAAKNIITKTFSILDLDPVRSRVEESPASQDTLGEPTFLTFLWKTRRTVYMRSTDLARLELEGLPT